MNKYKVQKRDIIKMGIRTLYFNIEAETKEEAEKLSEDLSDVNAYDSDFDIEETEHLETLIEEQ